MGIKQLYNDNLRKLPNEYRAVSIMQCVSDLKSGAQTYLRTCSYLVKYKNKIMKYLRKLSK